MEPREPTELPVEQVPSASEDFDRRALEFQMQLDGDDSIVRQSPPAFRAYQPRRFWPFVLFIATCLSTFWAGGWMFMTPPNALPGGVAAAFDWPSFVSGGLKYSVALMSILMAHEMGHFLQARRYGVPASWPWFVPMPFSPLGTMGAVIVQASGYADRKQMFDIGITGPLAGLIIAIPVTILGLQDSRVIDIEDFGGGLSFGNPLILEWLAALKFGRLRPGEDLVMTPLLHAGWVGILVTALNLIPIGQLDGGHILYGLIRRKAHLVAVSLLGLALSWMVFSGNWSYGVIVFMLLAMGPRHPPTRDDSVKLGAFRTILGWLTLGFIVLGFTANPITFEDRPAPKPEPEPKPTLFVESFGRMRDASTTKSTETKEDTLRRMDSRITERPTSAECWSS